LRVRVTTKMDFDIQTTHSVMETTQPTWDRLSRGRPFTSHRWYRFGEAALSDCSPTYITLFHRNEPTARAAFWLKHREWLPIASRLVRFGVEQFLRRRPLLMCAAPLACTPGLILPDAALRASALETIANAALELGRKSRASLVVFSYVQENEIRQVGWPEAFSAVSFSDEETSLEMAWPDFDSYLKHLAKSTRRNYRLHCRQADEMGVVITARPSVSDPERAITLIENVERYHHMGRRPWTRTTLENAHLADSAWIAAHIGDQLVGCCSVIGDGEAQIATLLGLDYSVPQYIYVYYRIMYAAVRNAIERGAKVLYGGGGAYELKRRLGFRVQPNDYLVVAATAKSVQRMGARLVRWAGLHTAAPKSADESATLGRAVDAHPDGP
jgi:predicted N-acyltransferase